MESTFDKEITLDSLQKIKAIPAMIPVVKKIISDLGHRSASLHHLKSNTGVLNSLIFEEF